MAFARSELRTSSMAAMIRIEPFGNCKDEVHRESGSDKDNKNNEDTSSLSGQGFPILPNKSLNQCIAVVSVLGSVGLFLSSRLDFGVYLKDISTEALPYKEALLFCVGITKALLFCVGITKVLTAATPNFTQEISFQSKHKDTSFAMTGSLDNHMGTSGELEIEMTRQIGNDGCWCVGLDEANQKMNR